MSQERVTGWISGLRDTLASVGMGQVVAWVAVAALTLVAMRLARRWIDREVQDVNRRHSLRKTTTYAGAAVIVAAALTLFVGQLGQVATVIGLVGAGLAIALQDLGKSAAGWVYLSTKPGFGPGARIEVSGVEGEVIDVGVLKTTVLEVGNVVHGRQSSGRLATVPNSRFLNETLYVTPTFALYTWQELQFLLTYESDWERAVEVLEEIARKEDEGIERTVERAFREMERRYAFKYGPRTAIVYVNAADSGVLLTLRHLTHIRERRGARDRITRAMLESVEREPSLEFAYPTTRFYRRGEERDPEIGSLPEAGPAD